jgi:hypothetical protein
VSEEKAQSILDHYPTFQSLMQVYENPFLNEPQKQFLLAVSIHSNF